MKSRPSPALVVAVFALVAALAGTAVAQPGAGTSAITKSKVKKISKKQANKAVDQFAAATLPVGGADLASIEERTQSTTINQNTNGTVEVSCNQGERVISGGWRDNNQPSNNDLLLVYEDHRTSNGWRAAGRAFGTNRTLTVFAYCLAP
jgi:hypothetical protein